MHPVWSGAVNDALATVSLDFLTGYIGGRGAALGDPAGVAVTACFACSNPPWSPPCGTPPGP